MTKLTLLLASSCSILGIVAPGMAQTGNSALQDVPAPTNSVQVEKATPAAASPDGAEEIVITGSRVITNGNNSPTPVTVVTVAQLQQTTPSNIPDGLNTLPVFSASNSQRTINNASGNTTGNYLNLRGIGVLRTLILIDGHRVPPTTQNGSIDVNTLPQLLLQRVDVVTGGASAVYGSDAVTGVVNFIIDKKFNGLKAQLQGGISSHKDDGSQRAGVAYGRDLFGGRGHFEASYEYYNSDGIDDKEDRPYGRSVYSYSGLGTSASPYTLITDSRNNTASAGGLILNGPLRGQQFVANGVLGPFVHGAPTSASTLESGGDGYFWKKSSLLARLRSHQAFARFDYDLAENVQFYTQASASESQNFNNFITSNLSTQTYTISAQNAFLPASVRNTLAGAGVSSFTFGKVFNNEAPISNDTRVRNVFVNPGLTGTLGEKFKFDLAYSFGMSKSRTINVNNPNTQRTSAALDAVTSPSGQIVCAVTLTNPGLYPGCIPLNPFGPTADDVTAFNYIQDNSLFHLTNKQHDLSGSIAGSLFNTWAGPVQMAVSGEFRHLTLAVDSTAEPTARPNCTGLRFNCNSVSGSVNQSNIIASARAKQSVSEGAFEVDVPILADLPLVQSLNINAAVRYTHYTTSGNATTWKVGADWHVVDDLRLRATRSRDIRAPTLNDLFAPVNESPFGFTDEHTKINFTSTLRSLGNPALTPEIANTTTVGGVYRPSWFPGFSFAADYYQISIKDAITSISGANITIQQLCEASNGSSDLCNLYIRPLPFSDRSAANYPTYVISQPLNVASVKAHGIDFEANYVRSLMGGNFSIRALASYQPKLVTVQFVGAPPQNAAGATGVPSWKVTGVLHYDIGGFGIDTQTRWRNAERRSANPTLVFRDGKIPAVSFTDLTVSYRVKRDESQAQFFFTVQNLFNKVSPLAAGAGSIGFSYPVVNGDDVIGRYYTAGVRFGF